MGKYVFEIKLAKKIIVRKTAKKSLFYSLWYYDFNDTCIAKH